MPKDRWSSFILRPETLLGWHRELVRRTWTCKRSGHPGRPPIDPEGRRPRSSAPTTPMGLRADPRRAAEAAEAGEPGRRRRPSGRSCSPRRGSSPTPGRPPTGNEFLRSQAAGILACDFFTVQTPLAVELGLRPLVSQDLDEAVTHGGRDGTSPLLRGTHSAWHPACEEPRRRGAAHRDQVPVARPRRDPTRCLITPSRRSAVYGSTGRGGNSDHVRD
jgi:hypothetical protein